MGGAWAHEDTLVDSDGESMDLFGHSAATARGFGQGHAAGNSRVDGVEQDSWIATKDEKLVKFSEAFHHVNVDGEIGK